MNVYVDCEFNGFGGELISMALVSESGAEFYEVLPCERPVLWVSQNVMPHLNKEPISHDEFRAKLAEFLHKMHGAMIIADWPEDIMHVCKIMLIGPGMMMPTPAELKFTINRKLHSGNSQIPHNALEDARAIRNAA